MPLPPSPFPCGSRTEPGSDCIRLAGDRQARECSSVVGRGAVPSYSFISRNAKCASLSAQSNSMRLGLAGRGGVARVAQTYPSRLGSAYSIDYLHGPRTGPGPLKKQWRCCVAVMQPCLKTRERGGWRRGHIKPLAGVLPGPAGQTNSEIGMAPRSGGVAQPAQPHHGRTLRGLLGGRPTEQALSRPDPHGWHDCIGLPHSAIRAGR